MDIAIIDYGAGNIQSIEFAFARLGRQTILTADADTIRQADRVIFPGVGHAKAAMIKLNETGLDKVIPELKQPVLGICLGMQLMCKHSEEGETEGLGIFETEVKRFNGQMKVPQMGWNTIEKVKGPLFEGLPENPFMYLVHSYYAESCRQNIATSNYGIEYASALQRDNFFGVQFHPEKSSRDGEKILSNFIELKR